MQVLISTDNENEGLLADGSDRGDNDDDDQHFLGRAVAPTLSPVGVGT